MEKKSYPYIFVPGMAGWGETSKLNAVLPYWGFAQFDIVENVRKLGFEAYAASVAPLGSAWDRACELYAQLAGGRVDYGKAHSEKYGHARYGKTFDRPLFAGWGEPDADGDVRKIHLICHSFGGVTARIMSYLLANGSAEERAATTDGSLSPLFAGGHGGRIFSITTYSAPHDGTDMEHALGHPLSDLVAGAYFFANYVSANTPLRSVYDVQLEHFNIGKKTRSLGLHEIHTIKKSGDTVFYDVDVDGSRRINRAICAQDDVYYFSFPVCGTSAKGEHKQTPSKAMLPGLRLFADLIGRYRETTPHGNVCDDAWLPNDGVVNTLSARAPSSEPSVEYQKDKPTPKGVWNVMPTLVGDHGSVVGWFRPERTTMPLYLLQIKRLEALAEPELAGQKG